MRLRKLPVRPTWKPLYADHSVRIESWSKFISEAYWNVEAGEVVVATAPGRTCRGPYSECAPGRASGLQSRPTGFESLHSLLDRRRGSTEKGAGLVNRFMLVRIQSSALDEFVPMV